MNEMKTAELHSPSPPPSPAFGTRKMFAHTTQTAETHQHAANLLWPQLVDEHTIGSPVRRRFPHLKRMQGSMTLGSVARVRGGLQYLYKWQSEILARKQSGDHLPPHVQ